MFSISWPPFSATLAILASLQLPSRLSPYISPEEPREPRRQFWSRLNLFSPLGGFSVPPSSLRARKAVVFKSVGAGAIFGRGSRLFSRLRRHLQPTFSTAGRARTRELSSPPKTRGRIGRFQDNPTWAPARTDSGFESERTRRQPQIHADFLKMRARSVLSVSTGQPRKAEAVASLGATGAL